MNLYLIFILSVFFVSWNYVAAEQVTGSVDIIEPPPTFCGKTIEQWEDSGANVIIGTDSPISTVHDGGRCVSSALGCSPRNSS